MIIKIKDFTIETLVGNIADQTTISAVVNAANAELKPGGGVAGAIHRIAGPYLEEECRTLAPIKPGEAVITNAHDLPNQYVIHCLGPVYGTDKPEAELLANCYRNALRLAEEKHIASIAFPAISTGAFNYPLDEATDVALRTVREVVHSLENVQCIRFVLISSRYLNVYEAKLRELFE